ncbi:MAG TPA: hypothetical protein VGU01_03330 [Sphingomicrobium sp.]|nr:hypothetical protein [Sphingomicrobium sp.]
MKIQIECLPEPKLAFGQGKTGFEPRRLLAKAGPADAGRLTNVRLALVGTGPDIEAAKPWLLKLNGFLAAHEGNSARYREWPGAPSALGVQFSVDDAFVRRVDEQRLQLARAKGLESKEGFEDLLDLFDSRIQGLLGDNRPDCIVVCLSDEAADLRVENPRLTAAERRALEQLRAEEESQQMSLFTPTPDELKAADDLRMQADDLLFRTFYRALKARAQQHVNAVPIQVLRRETVDRPHDKGQSLATRAWNIGSALYYKAGGLPWRPADLPENTCFVGISFHHLKKRTGTLVYASVAQAFSTDVEPFTLKGATIDHNQRHDKQPYLNEAQATELLRSVLDQYEAQSGMVPARIVVHKTTMYHAEEERGFRLAAHDRVPACDLIWMRSTPFRLIRKGMQEPWRGTLCTVGSETYLFTSGFVPWWNEYPGPHIPAPIEIGASGETDIRQRASEILALTKMNWNSTEGMSRYPITLSFAKRVGQLMSELSENQAPNPSYRFHM